MSSRDLILNSLRKTERTPTPLPQVPLFDQHLPPLLETFKASFEKIGGTWCDLPAGEDLNEFVKKRFPHAHIICSATAEVNGNRDINHVKQPCDLHDVDLGVIRPAFAVAETGSVWLSEHEYQVNALGYLSQHLLVLLDINDIIGNLHQAYHRPEFFEVNYAVLVSGPSATADIEGVLVRGAQGVRSLTLIPVPRPQCQNN